MERNIGLTDRFVTLRPYQTDDIGSLYEAARESIAEAFVWMPWCHPDYSIEENKEFIESLPQKWVRTSQTKKGVATAVTFLLAKFAFDELKLNKVEIRIDVDNIASLRVAEKAGAVKEGF